jgi:sugar lactone lactonase YvrE
MFLSQTIPAAARRRLLPKVVLPLWLPLFCIVTMWGQSPVTIPGDRPFPESLSSTSNGTLYIGSASDGMVFRAKPHADIAETWIAKGTGGLQRVLGVLADEKSGTLWVCSTHTTGEPTALKSFSLASGALRGSFAFPGGTGVCNDIAIGPSGFAFATDTMNGRILRLAPGGRDLEVWANDPRLVQADGLAFSGDFKNLYVNTFRTGHLFGIPVQTGGAAGSIFAIKTSRPLELPDGLRSIGDNQFLMIEGAGRLDKLTITGDTAKVEVLKEGFNGPTAVTPVHGTAWVIEGKLKYMNDPAFKTQDPGPFKAYPIHYQTVTK